MKSFTREEVSKHNTSSDCWTIIHGKVYDVTKYLFKHPGGKNLIFRNAGGDSTTDFEGMFHSGKARAILSDMEIGVVEGHAVSSHALGVTGKKTDMPKKTGPYGLGAYDPDKPFKVPAIPKKSFVVNKESSPIKKLSKTEEIQFQLDEINLLNYNTNIYRFKTNSRIKIPLGHHITVKVDINGTIIKRQYTPLQIKSNYFTILVKKYDTGKVSDYIHKMKPGDMLTFLGPFGSWKYRPATYTRLVMIAAGTGLTPMYQILNKIMSDDISETKVSLLFANKDVKDILLRKKLDTWASINRNNFEVFYLLSQPSVQHGLIGRISSEIFNRTIAPNPSDDKEMVLICGSDGFNDTAKKILIENQYPIERIHTF